MTKIIKVIKEDTGKWYWRGASKEFGLVGIAVNYIYKKMKGGQKK